MGQPTGLKFNMQTGMDVGINFCFRHFALRALLYGTAQMIWVGYLQDDARARARTGQPRGPNFGV